MGANRNRELVDRIAQELLLKDKITLELDSAHRRVICVDRVMMPEAISSLTASPKILGDIVWETVKRKMLWLRPETLGRIASTGIAAIGSSLGTPLYEVNGEGDLFLDLRDSGAGLLVTIARTVIIARMWDLLEASLRHRLEQGAAGQSSA